MSERFRAFAFARPTAFAVTGWDGDEAFLRVVRTRVAEPVRAPHHSDLLLLCGRIPSAWAAPLRALFETLPLPRLAVWLRPDPDAETPDLPLLELDPEHPDRDALLERLLDLDAPGNRPVLPDKPPAPWRGKGDHGQGGEGMMGGKPYGRPMAMVGNDPDGLMLGALSSSLGPFFPGLPSGLQLKLTLQGERIGSVDEVVNWFPERPASELEATMPALRAAMGQEVRVADVERERIRSHLRTMASILDLAGLEAVARRFLITETTAPRQLKRLVRAAERCGLRRVLEGVGTIGRELAEDLGLAGPAARASGVARDARADARADDPVFRDAGFEPVILDGGDAWARWCVLCDECLQSAELIPKLAERTTRAAEAPSGRWVLERDGVAGASRTNMTVLARVLPRLLWPDALLTIASLGLDMRDAAAR